MSTLKVDAIRHNSATSDAITTSADGTCTAKLTSVGGGQLSHRNKARNGEMKISQRGTTFSPTTSEMYLIDGWMTQHGSGGNLDCTVTQSTDAPAGFSKSLKITPDSTNTPSGSQNGMLAQRLEGQEFQDFAFGTSDAKTITVSWYAKTSATGAGNYTVKVEYNNGTNNYAVNKLFAFTTTWTRYSYTIPATGTATSVGIRDDDQLGLRIEYHLFSGPDDVHSQFTQWTLNPSPTYKVISGQKNFMDNTNNELYITGLQIEVGDTMTEYEHISIGEELRRCERYFQCLKGPSLTGTGSNEATYGIALAYNNNRTLWSYIFKTEMRTNPTVSMSNLAYLQGLGVVGGWNAASSFVSTNNFSKFGGRVDLNWSGTPYTVGHAVEMRITSDGLLSFDAEL
jgi:hypothetical protein